MSSRAGSRKEQAQARLEAGSAPPLTISEPPSLGLFQMAEDVATHSLVMP